MLREALATCCLAGALAISTQNQNSLNVVETTSDTTSSAILQPVPTATKCIVIIVIQYMVVYLVLALVRTYHDFSGVGHGTLLQAIEDAKQKLTFGPMLCVLFIAVRLRVQFLSDGKGEPQSWVQMCMIGVTVAVLVQVLHALVSRMMMGKTSDFDETSSAQDAERPAEEEKKESDAPKGSAGAAFVKYAIMLLLYGGLAGIMYGICTYLPPGEEDLSKLPAPAPSIQCTMYIAVAFFCVQLVVAGCETYTDSTGKQSPRLKSMMTNATSACEYGPMLCILFLALRMRAMQHHAEPQRWAMDAMFASTAALIVQMLAAMCQPLFLVRDDDDSPPPNKAVGICFVAIRFLCMIGFYGGAVVVSSGIVLFEAPQGETRPISPTVHCVMALTSQYFFVYLCINAMQMVADLGSGDTPVEKGRFWSAFDAARQTVAFAPMLAILFVTTRMYALQLTDGKGAPQAYVQDGMVMSTWAVLISFIVCLLTGLARGSVKVDSDGNVIDKFDNKMAAFLMTALRYFTLILLYGGIFTVISGLFAMTPENANGRDGIWGISHAVDVAGPPPGPGSAAHHGF